MCVSANNWYFKLSIELVFFFCGQALTYLQTCPQIWSSNLTVLAQALKQCEDTWVKKKKIAEKEKKKHEKNIMKLYWMSY